MMNWGMFSIKFDKFNILFEITKFHLFFICLKRIVKEEIVDESATLPNFNGRVISWV